MGIFSGMLLASDFDGTLTGSDGKIPQSNIDAIKYFISEGGLFTVSTGRTKVGFHNYTDEIINAPVLLGNGAMAYDYKNGKVAFVNSINNENIFALNNILNKNPYAGTEFYGVNDEVYVKNCNEKNIRHFNGLKIESFSEISDVSENMFPFVKIMASVGDKTAEFQSFLQSNDIGSMKYIPTNGSFVEILSVSAGKGKALYQLADYLGIEHTYAFCIGDGSNDADMLKEAYLSFCPESGEILAKDAADVIVCTSDKGCVADAIRYIEENIVRK